MSSGPVPNLVDGITWGSSSGAGARENCVRKNRMTVDEIMIMKLHESVFYILTKTVSV